MLPCVSCSFPNYENARLCGYCGLYLKPIGDYTLLERIGIGGFAEVYRAVNRYTGHPAAIKFLHRKLLNDREIEQRFLREVEILRDLHSPNIVQIYDFGVLEDIGLYLVMEWIDGETLDVYVQRHPDQRLNQTEALRLFSQLLYGLSRIHERRVVHRDLKPKNFMVVQEQGQAVLKILDFGIAWMAGRQALTERGMFVGSTYFMSPEQFRAQKELFGPSTDLYVAGLLLTWMLTGKHIFTGSSIKELAVQHCYSMPPMLSELCPEEQFLPSLESVVTYALQKEPNRRFQTALDFLEALNNPLAFQKQFLQNNSLHSARYSEVPNISIAPFDDDLFFAGDMTELPEPLMRPNTAYSNSVGLNEKTKPRNITNSEPSAQNPELMRVMRGNKPETSQHLQLSTTQPTTDMADYHVAYNQIPANNSVSDEPKIHTPEGLESYALPDSRLSTPALITPITHGPTRSEKAKFEVSEIPIAEARSGEQIAEDHGNAIQHESKSAQSKVVLSDSAPSSKQRDQGIYAPTNAYLQPKNSPSQSKLSRMDLSVKSNSMREEHENLDAEQPHIDLLVKSVSTCDEVPNIEQIQYSEAARQQTPVNAMPSTPPPEIGSYHRRCDPSSPPADKIPERLRKLSDMVAALPDSRTGRHRSMRMNNHNESDKLSSRRIWLGSGLAVIAMCVAIVLLRYLSLMPAPPQNINDPEYLTLPDRPIDSGLPHNPDPAKLHQEQIPKSLVSEQSNPKPIGKSPLSNGTLSKPKTRATKNINPPNKRHSLIKSNKHHKATRKKYHRHTSKQPKISHHPSQKNKHQYRHAPKNYKPAAKRSP